MSDLLGRIERWAGLADEDLSTWSELELTGGYYELWVRGPGDGPLDLWGSTRDDITIRPKAEDSLTTTIAFMHTGFLDRSDEGRIPLQELVIDVYEDMDDEKPVTSHVFAEPTVYIQSVLADTATLSIVECEAFGFRSVDDE